MIGLRRLLVVWSRIGGKRAARRTPQGWVKRKESRQKSDRLLEDRANQIGLPLLAVAPDEATRAKIINVLIGQQATVAEGRADTIPGEVFDAIAAIADIGGVVHPGDVSKEINRRWAERDGVELRELRKPMTVQKLAGHKNIVTTIKFYTLVSMDDRREAVEKFHRRHSAG